VARGPLRGEELPVFDGCGWKRKKRRKGEARGGGHLATVEKRRDQKGVFTVRDDPPGWTQGIGIPGRAGRLEQETKGNWKERGGSGKKKSSGHAEPGIRVPIKYEHGLLDRSLGSEGRKQSYKRAANERNCVQKKSQKRKGLRFGGNLEPERAGVERPTVVRPRGRRRKKKKKSKKKGAKKEAMARRVW